MAISPDLFKVEDLDLDRLNANLVELDETLKILDLQLQRDDLTETERVVYEARRESDRDMRTLTEKLIERKRASLS